MGFNGHDKAGNDRREQTDRRNEGETVHAMRDSFRLPRDRGASDLARSSAIPSSRNTLMARKPPGFARKGSTSPLGKLDDRLEANKIESVVKARLQVLAAESGKPLNEFLRNIYRVLAFGPDAVKSMHTDEVDRVVRMLGGKGERP